MTLPTLRLYLQSGLLLWVAGTSTMSHAAASTDASGSVNASTDVSTNPSNNPSNRAGLAVKSADGNFAFKVGGRIMWDTDTFDGALNRDNAGDSRFNSQLRRSRLEISGTVYEDYKFKFDVDYKDGTGDAEFHTIGVQYTGWDFASIFVGRTKEPFGLEELTSSKAIASIERNYYTEATDTDSQPHFGVRLDGMIARVGWSAGVFNPNGNPKDSDGGDQLAFTARVFGAPINNDSTTVHLGAAYTDRGLDGPTSQNGFKLDVAESGGKLDSSELLIDDDTQMGLEALFIHGPFSLQSEYFMKDMGGAADGPDGTVNHYYLQATYALTGERRAYKASSGVTDILKPKGRRGAVELVAKFDHISFDAHGQPEEEVDGVLVGVNWYVNRNIKLALNYIVVDSNNVVGVGEDEDADVISTRIQLAF